MTKNIKKPAVRFKEFTDAWEQRELGEHLIKNNERNKELTISNVESVSNKKGFVKQTEQFEDYSVASSDLSNYYIIRENMFAYNPSRINVGSIAYKEKGDDIAVVSPLYVSFATKNIDDKYLWYWFKTSSFEQQRQVSSEGGVRDTLSFDKVNSMQIALPSVAEQQQIGSYFRNLDNLITLHQRKLETLKKLKKSMLQKMFPQNDKSVPEFRFEGFTDAWEQRELGEVSQFAKGFGYSKNDLRENGTPIILYGRLYTKYETIIDDVDTFVEQKANSIYSTGEEVIVPASGETAEDIARASAVGKSGFILGGDLNIIYPIKQIDTVFLALSISNGEQQKSLSKKAQGKSVVHLHNSDLKEVSLLYPCNAEQQKIGTFFRNLDTLITLHQRKLETLKKLKKSMLQKMFV